MDKPCRWLLVASHNSAQATQKSIHTTHRRCTAFTVYNTTEVVDVLARSHYDYVHVNIPGHEYALLDSIVANGGFVELFVE